MAQGVGMDGTVKARALRGFLGGVVYRFCVDGVIGSMPTVAGKSQRWFFSATDASAGAVVQAAWG